MAAVAKRQSAALAQQLFRNIETLNIFLINFEIALAAPFDENCLRDKALETDVEHGIVKKSLVRHGQFAIVFTAVGRQVEKRPSIDRSFAGLECDFHEYLSIAEIIEREPDFLLSRRSQLSGNACGAQERNLISHYLHAERYGRFISSSRFLRGTAAND